MRPAAVATLVALVVVLAPTAVGIHRGQKDNNYDDHYTVQGRIVNPSGLPLYGVEVRAELRGLTGIAEGTDCGGDYAIPIPTTATLTEFDELKITAGGQTKTVKVNLYTRRSDVTFTVPGEVIPQCSLDPVVEAWEYRYTVEGRVVNRSRGDRDHNGMKLFASIDPPEFANMILAASWTDANGTQRTGTRDAYARGGYPVTDGAGNFQFSFVVAPEEEGGFRISAENVTKVNVTLRDRTIDVPLDFRTRYSYVEHVRGSPPAKDTPALAPALVAAAALAAALLVARRRAA